MFHILNLFVIQVHAGPPPEDAHAVAHWREAVLLHPLRQNIRPGGQPQATHQGSYWGAPLQGQQVHICAKLVIFPYFVSRKRFLHFKSRPCSSIAD
jgi:hypothetical protein